jgi:hypothetical protein
MAHRTPVSLLPRVVVVVGICVVALMPATASTSTPAPGRAAYDGAYETFDAGCVDFSDAADIDRAIQNGLGPLMAWDAPHQYQLSKDRTLWIVQDPYVDRSGSASTLLEAQYANSAAIVWGDDGCGTVLIAANPTGARGFEMGDGNVGRDRFFWPLGGAENNNGILTVAWAEMVSNIQPRGMLDGIARYSPSTWLATYDSNTLQRLSFEKVQHIDSVGYDQQLAFDVVDNGDEVFVLSNTNLIDLQPVSSWQADMEPLAGTTWSAARSNAELTSFEFWDGETWAEPTTFVDGIDAAAPVHRSGWIAHQPHVVPFKQGGFLNVVTVDEFWGQTAEVLYAPSIVGPWELIETYTFESRPETHSDTDVVTYAPMIPHQAASCGAAPIPVIVSQNAAVWEEAIDRPELYLPVLRELDTVLIPACQATSEQLNTQTNQL